ncbi:phage tail tip lysozyme [Wukongibacter sp. M2B1]|uniref:phage tail tip lysozyme n=1 Tax=Wukongibacter sp. M2B1 TaxID=3088895 RepID=UPI003D7A0CF5
MMDKIAEDTTFDISSKKRNMIVGIGQLLLDNNFKPAFVAGFLANIMEEGKLGQFESSYYKTNPSDKPDYFDYLEENYDYINTYSGENIMDIGIAKTKIISDVSTAHDAKPRIGFGLGCVQWTFLRTKTLVDYYEDVCRSDKPTLEECYEAEGKMIIHELKTGDYSSIYTDWKNAGNDKDAYEAGRMLCIRYESPASGSAKARKRAELAKEVYNIMIAD